MLQGTELPWSNLGSFLIDAKKQMEEALAGSDAIVSCLEITIYRRESDPVEEYNLILGNTGKRMLPDDLIFDISDPKEQRVFETDNSKEENVPSSIEQTVDATIEKLISQLSEIIPQDNLSTGIRTIITTNNPGDWCYGGRCEFKFSTFSWEWRKYFRQNGVCMKEWTGKNC